MQIDCSRLDPQSCATLRAQAQAYQQGQLQAQQKAQAQSQQLAAQLAQYQAQQKADIASQQAAYLQGQLQAQQKAQDQAQQLAAQQAQYQAQQKAAFAAQQAAYQQGQLQAQKNTQAQAQQLAAQEAQDQAQQKATLAAQQATYQQGQVQAQRNAQAQAQQLAAQVAHDEAQQKADIAAQQQAYQEGQLQAQKNAQAQAQQLAAQKKQYQARSNAIGTARPPGQVAVLGQAVAQSQGSRDAVTIFTTAPIGQSSAQAQQKTASAAVKPASPQTLGTTATAPVFKPYNAGDYTAAFVQAVPGEFSSAGKQFAVGTVEGTVATGRSAFAFGQGVQNTEAYVIDHPAAAARSLQDAGAAARNAVAQAVQHPQQSIDVASAEFAQASSQTYRSVGTALQTQDAGTLTRPLGQTVGSAIVLEGAGNAAQAASRVTQATDASAFVQVGGTSAKFANNAKLTSHFEDHGADFSSSSASQYQTQASKFLAGNTPSGVLQKVRSNGDIVRFNPTTNEFGVISKDGTIRTYFKPDPTTHGYPSNLEYFNAQ